MTEDPRLVLTIGAVAQRLGVAVPTLRSWDRRYGLGPSSRDPGRHRRYTAGDLAKLRTMIELTGEGVPPAAAARIVQGGEPDSPTLRDGGGTDALAVGRVERTVRGLARSASRLDVPGVRRQVEKCVQQRGVQRTWQEVLIPLLNSIGDNFERGAEDAVAVEHVATAGIVPVLRTTRVPEERGRLPALLSCAPEEQHSLPMEALHAALAERGTSSRFLGARVPAGTAITVARRLRPRTVAIWSSAAATARKSDVAGIAEHCSQLLLCGPGWSNVRAAREHSRPGSLAEAVDLVLGALPGTAHAARTLDPPQASRP